MNKIKNVLKEVKIENEGKNSECPICLEALLNSEIEKLECDHKFHKKCINKWLIQKQTCPLRISVTDN
uniref:RING-type E3 ubiquitin transferase n=1 Tax=Ditylenchus dipsaci TaxID=166011 RepID=A0A915D5C9_9BILA